MTAIEAEAQEPPKKSGKALILGLLGAVVLGGGAFFATYSSMILPASTEVPKSEHVFPEVSFVALEPMTISLGPAAHARHLRMVAQLEVVPGTESEVTVLAPRVLDVLNTYLRAVSEADLENPASLERLRAQMLRRVEVVVGEGVVQDFLITEFVLN